MTRGVFFEIEHKKWEKFGDMCLSQRMNKGQKLNYLIDEELTKEISEPGIRPHIDQDIGRWDEYFYTLTDEQMNKIASDLRLISLHALAYAKNPAMRKTQSGFANHETLEYYALK